MYSKKEKKNLNLTLKSLIIKNRKKNFYLPLLNEQSRNISLKVNKTSIGNTCNNNYSNLAMKKFQSNNKNKILLNNKNNNTISNIQKLDMLKKKLTKNKNLAKELLKNKSFQKCSLKKIITEKSLPNISNNNIIQKKSNYSKKFYNTININNNNTININQKNNNTLFNNLDYYYCITEDNDPNFKTARNNIINVSNNANKEKNCNKEKKIFGIMLKKRSSVNNNFINKINRINNNYYLYEKNVENRKNNSFKTNNTNE